jgi:hypothetical protein
MPVCAKSLTRPDLRSLTEPSPDVKGCMSEVDPYIESEKVTKQITEPAAPLCYDLFDSAHCGTGTTGFVQSLRTLAIHYD